MREAGGGDSSTTITEAGDNVWNSISSFPDATISMCGNTWNVEEYKRACVVFARRAACVRCDEREGSFHGRRAKSLRVDPDYAINRISADRAEPRIK